MYKLLLLIAIIFVSCKHPVDRNDQMSSLLNKQKATKEEINIASYKELEFKQKAKDSAYAGRDSTVYQPLIDSQVYYYMQGVHLEGREKELQFSIDSLSKMN
jgi:hypothetical protein